MRTVGTVVRGIRTPIIKEGDNLKKIVVDSLLRASENEGFKFRNRDIVAITEAVVGISEGNYATVDQIGEDVKNKFGVDHIGIVFPTPMSRNRFSLLLKGFARGCKEFTILLSYPADEVGNGIMDETKLRNIYDILQSKLVKRGLSIKILDPQKVEDALGGAVRQVYNLRKGLTQELAKKITGDIKDSKIKVQASIQGDQVRVTGKSKDDLQAVIALLRENADKYDYPLQFQNYR